MSEDVVTPTTPTEIVVICKDILRVADCIAVWQALQVLDKRNRLGGALEREIANEAGISEVKTVSALRTLATNVEEGACTEVTYLQFGTGDATLPHYKQRPGIVPKFNVRLTPTPEYKITITI